MYIDEKKAAAFLDIAPITLHMMRCNGSKTLARKNEQPAAIPKIPYSKFGRTIRYRLEDLEQFAAAHRVDPSAEG